MIVRWTAGDPTQPIDHAKPDVSAKYSRSSTLRKEEGLLKTQILIVIGLLALPLTTLSEDSEQRYERLVDEILEVTGSLKIGKQMGAMVVGQMIQVLKSSGSDLPDRAYVVLETEVQMTIKEEMESGSFNEMMYPIYAKYLDEDDLQAALSFYATKEGQKFVQAMPLMAAEGMEVGQRWGAALGPKIAQRVQQRLADEGYELQ